MSAAVLIINFIADVVSKIIAYIKNDLSKQAQPLRESLQLRFAVMCAALYRLVWHFMI